VQKERNRAAATKCRNKSKAAASQLESEAREAEELNAELLARRAALREENLTLRNLLLAHVDCECELIHVWARNQAKRVADEAVRRAAAAERGGLADGWEDGMGARERATELAAGGSWDGGDEEGVDFGSDDDAEYEEEMVEDGME